MELWKKIAKETLRSSSPLGKFIVDIVDDEPKEPNRVEKIKTVFSDVETDGKKEGYKEAAREYERVYEEIEENYRKMIQMVKEQQSSYNATMDKLISRLEELEGKKESLSGQIERKANEVSGKYNIPKEDVKRAAVSGTLLTGDGFSYPIGVLNLVYQYKERKYIEAKRQGYAEAKALYEKKIKKLKAEMNRLQSENDVNMQNFQRTIDQLLDAIVDKETQVAELRVLL